ncbi:MULTISPECIES: AI-2E family transporter [unclassified Rhizobium]|uniref:AI-2E family transporter n=1 Tax=unclassified Rhizobium TaxID=2613769 RepID=UPI001614904D|nr:MULTISPECIES: AI-2E family transporter [unclassified Rhizobium]MBB3316798.1 putative PurR-regulated permease PerM [Rhizobium sp. BK181]MBB3541356.1 putative PurR-regulated permease PerM [Rhizobium sp. BK399]MCS3740080.1 putative PurR-regulated permease PerM [Rhizobium sp. BK661]MCS4091970.1 putative PurR-regulated permease PerM [Rhizobium sp. BK176]
MEQQTSGTAIGASPAQISVEARVSDLVRIGIIGLFAYWSLQLIAPFALIVIWSAILAVALFPLFNGLSKLLGDRPVLSATVIVIACLVLIIAPLALVAVNFADATQDLVAQLKSDNFTLPAAPEAIRGWPVVGERLYAGWNQVAGNLAEAIMKFQAPLREVMGVILAKLASIGGGVLSFVASIILSGIFLTMSPRLASTIQVLAGRIGGERGVGFARLAGSTVRNVSRGVIGVALLQTLLCGLCFAFFDIPARGALTFLVFMLCLMQLGPGLVLIPAIVWAWFSWPTSIAFAFTVVAIPITVVDNVLKPILMSRGLSTPMPVILIGVIGGTLSHGLLGLFLGPIVLSVFYELLRAWAWPSEAPDAAMSSPTVPERAKVD